MAQSKRFSPMRYTAATEEAAVNGALELVGATRDEADYEVLDVTEKGVTVRVKPRDTNAPAAAPVATAPIATAPIATAPVAEPVAAVPIETPQVEEPVAEIEEEEDGIVEDGIVEDGIVEDDEDEYSDEEADSEIEAQLVVDEEDLPTLEEEDEAVEEDEADEESFDDEGEEDESETSLDESETESPALEAEPEPVAPANEETIVTAKATAQEFLDKMGMSALCSYESGATATTIPLIIEGEDVGILIGKHGSTLQAFQYLLNLTVNNGSEPDSGVRVVVDAGNYRARRQNSLEQTARAAAQRARMSGRPVRLDAMPASERRIIHMFLQNEQGITTQSEGREPQRRLVIFPSQGGATGGSGRYEERGGGERRGMGGFNRGRGGRGFRR